MNISSVIAAAGVAWAAFTALKSMGQKGQIVITTAGLIAAWGICASIIYKVVSSLRIIEF